MSIINTSLRIPPNEILGSILPTLKTDPIRQAIARAVDNQFSPITYMKTIFIYDPSLKCYIEDQGHISSCVNNLLNDHGKNVNDPNILFEALGRANLKNYGSVFPFNPDPTLINCKNGVVKIGGRSIVLLAHSPQFLFNYCIDTNFNETIFNNGSPDLMKILNSWGDPDFVLEVGALAICQMLKKFSYKRAFMVEGSAHGGKSTMLDLVSKTFGINTVSNMDLQRLSEDKFAFSNLENKIINISDDMPHFTVKTTGKFKQITGSIHQPIEGKFKNVRSGIITAPHLFACNDLPEIAGINDPAFFARWKITEFKNKFPVNESAYNEILSDKICEQLLCAFIRRAIQILNGDPLDEIDPDEIEDLWRSRGLNADKFIYDCLISDDYRSRIPFKEISQFYHEWVKYRISLGEITPAVSDRYLSGKLVKSGYGRVKTNGVSVITGIRLNTKIPPFNKRSEK